MDARVFWYFYTCWACALIHVQENGGYLSLSAAFEEVQSPRWEQKPTPLLFEPSKINVVFIRALLIDGWETCLEQPRGMCYPESSTYSYRAVHLRNLAFTLVSFYLFIFLCYSYLWWSHSYKGNSLTAEPAQAGKYSAHFGTPHHLFSIHLLHLFSLLPASSVSKHLSGFIFKLNGS